MRRSACTGGSLHKRPVLSIYLRVMVDPAPEQADRVIPLTFPSEGSLGTSRPRSLRMDDPLVEPDLIQLGERYGDLVAVRG